MNSKSVTIVALAVMTAAITLLGGCSGGCSREPEAVNAVPDRMHDPAYLAKLDSQRKEMYEVMDMVAKAREALDAARSSEAGADVIAQCETALKRAEDALAENRRRSQEIVREQLRRQADAELKAFKDETKKGN